MKKITKILLPIASAIAVAAPLVCLTSCSDYSIRIRETTSPKNIEIDHTKFKNNIYSVYLKCDTNKKISITSITAASTLVVQGEGWKLGTSSYGGCSLSIYTDKIAHAAKGQTIITITCTTY